MISENTSEVEQSQIDKLEDLEADLGYESIEIEDEFIFAKNTINVC